VQLLYRAASTNHRIISSHIKIQSSRYPWIAILLGLVACPTWPRTMCLQTSRRLLGPLATVSQRGCTCLASASSSNTLDANHSLAYGRYTTYDELQRFFSRFQGAFHNDFIMYLQDHLPSQLLEAFVARNFEHRHHDNVRCSALDRRVDRCALCVTSQTKMAGVDPWQVPIPPHQRSCRVITPCSLNDVGLPRLHLLVPRRSPPLRNAGERESSERTSGLSEYHRSSVSLASCTVTPQSFDKPIAVFPYAMLKFSTWHTPGATQS